MSAKTAASNRTVSIPEDRQRPWLPMVERAATGEYHYNCHRPAMWDDRPAGWLVEEERATFLGRVVQDATDALGRGKVVRVLVTWEDGGDDSPG